MKINVYVDGFNLYYGAVKKTPYKWLNPLTMSRLLFPNDTINRIKFFPRQSREELNRKNLFSLFSWQSHEELNQ